MTFGAEKFCMVEEEPKDIIEEKDYVEITGITSSPFYQNGDHAQVKRVDQDGFLIQLITPRKRTPFNNNEHWIPRQHVKKFTPLGNLPYTDN